MRNKEKIKGRLSTLSVDNLIDEQLNMPCIQRSREAAKNCVNYYEFLS